MQPYSTSYSSIRNFFCPLFRNQSFQPNAIDGATIYKQTPQTLTLHTLNVDIAISPLRQLCTHISIIFHTNSFRELLKHLSCAIIVEYPVNRRQFFLHQNQQTELKKKKYVSKFSDEKKEYTNKQK